MEVILDVLTGLTGLVILENMIGSWNGVEMSIIKEIITTSGFYGSHFGCARKPYCSWHGRKYDYDLKSGRNIN